MKTLKIALLGLALGLVTTYGVGGTKYVPGKTYKTTGQPMVERSSSAKQEFLKSQGLTKVPSGYQVDHKKPLSQGGSDTPSNMHLMPTEEHKQKTAAERKATSTTHTPKSSSSSYKSSSHSTPRSSSGSYKKSSSSKSYSSGGGRRK